MSPLDITEFFTSKPSPATSIAINNDTWLFSFREEAVGCDLGLFVTLLFDLLIQ
jgi:hypothetical protein